MSRVGRVGCVSVVFVVGLVTFGCGDDPPAKEMQLAQIAIDGARAAGADRYARDEVIAADEALVKAREAVGQHDYRLALNKALDSRERALAATAQAADNWKRARVQAEHAIETATAAVMAAVDRIAAAERAHTSGKTLAPARRAAVDSKVSLQEARARLEAGDFQRVEDILAVSTANLTRAMQDLAAAGTTPQRRHR